MRMHSSHLVEISPQRTCLYIYIYNQEFSFEFQVNVLCSGIIYESEYFYSNTDEEIQYDSDSSVSDSGNSFENENEEHSVITTALGTEMSFLVGGLSPNLVAQLDITQSFSKISACIFIISLFCILAFTNNKKYLLKLHIFQSLS